MIDDSKLAYNAEEAANYVGLSKKAMYKLRQKGYIKSIKCGRYFIFPKTELDRFSNECHNNEFFLIKVNEVIK